MILLAALLASLGQEPLVLEDFESGTPKLQARGSALKAEQGGGVWTVHTGQMGNRLYRTHRLHFSRAKGIV